MKSRSDEYERGRPIADLLILFFSIYINSNFDQQKNKRKKKKRKKKKKKDRQQINFVSSKRERDTLSTGSPLFG